MNIKTQIEKNIGREISPSKIDGVDYQYFDKDKKSFVNITIPDKDLITFTNEVMKSGKLPLATQKSKTIFFDYGGANVAKQLHIGHLRSPIVGEALKRVFKAFGHKTISDTFFGDWGLQMGLVLAQMIDEGFIKNGDFVKDTDLDTLNAIYPAASKRSKEDPEFYKRAESITAMLQQKARPYFGLWRTIRDVSVNRIKESYKILNCTFDTFKGESDASEYIDEVLEILKKRGATKSEGCLVFDVKTETDTAPMPPVILQKSNGGELYATTDIATAYYRYKKYKPDQFIYINDARQSLQMEQNFRVLKKGGLVPESVQFTHVPFGTMNGTDGKPFKTRAGDTIKLDEVIQMVTDAAEKKMRAVTADSKKNLEVAQLIGISALKFADLCNNVRKDYIFDIEKFTSFEGKTGPYLLYTVARINSIFKKMGATAFADISSPTSSLRCGLWSSEKSATPWSNPIRDILRAAVKLADSYTSATQVYSLNPIVDATYNLAAQFNLLYANESIQKSDDNLFIAAFVKICLLFALDTLAITPVDEM
ncbi:MAG: arginine--tRNA ligase [Christensenellaceae bacterium]|jgi:arginyl-tRNA synthetase|nr:arginine--tRNA ligase [Christensenellaceae bacterium]